MPNVHGIEFNANQSELVKDLVRELLKDGNCVVYALNNMKPNGELRMATTLPTPNRREVGGVFLRIRPGINQATIVRPMNAKAGDPLTKLAKITQAETLELIRIWRKETKSGPILIKSMPITIEAPNILPTGKSGQTGR
ncbi:CRISPR-associated protein Cas5 [Tunturiibacter psychrotolerans]|uniref:CRISPR-associated protein Cas5 n=1 Tax=Tunturiibacter psychrotolerans TaxID=3069686 RepID=UPI003D1AEBD9